MILLASSGGLTLVFAFGAGAIGIVVLVGGLFAMLESEDRRKLARVLRHPFAVALEERDEPDEEDYSGPR
jgi:hypothetical protein